MPYEPPMITTFWPSSENMPASLPRWYARPRTITTSVGEHHETPRARSAGRIARRDRSGIRRTGPSLHDPRVHLREPRAPGEHEGRLLDPWPARCRQVERGPDHARHEPESQRL